MPCLCQTKGRSTSSCSEHGAGRPAGDSGRRDPQGAPRVDDDRVQTIAFRGPAPHRDHEAYVLGELAQPATDAGIGSERETIGVLEVDARDGASDLRVHGRGAILAGLDAEHLHPGAAVVQARGVRAHAGRRSRTGEVRESEEIAHDDHVGGTLAGRRAIHRSSPSWPGDLSVDPERDSERTDRASAASLRGDVRGTKRLKPCPRPGRVDRLQELESSAPGAIAAKNRAAARCRRSVATPRRRRRCARPRIMRSASGGCEP